MHCTITDSQLVASKYNPVTHSDRALYPVFLWLNGLVGKLYTFQPAFSRTPRKMV